MDLRAAGVSLILLPENESVHPFYRTVRIAKLSANLTGKPIRPRLLLIRRLIIEFSPVNRDVQTLFFGHPDCIALQRTKLSRLRVMSRQKLMKTVATIKQRGVKKENRLATKRQAWQRYRELFIIPGLANGIHYGDWRRQRRVSSAATLSSVRRSLAAPSSQCVTPALAAALVRSSDIDIGLPGTAIYAAADGNRHRPLPVTIELPITPD